MQLDIKRTGKNIRKPYFKFMKKLLIIFFSIFILSTKVAFGDGHAIKKEGFFSKDFNNF